MNEIDETRENIRKFKEEILDYLHEEFEKAKKDLVETFLPVVMADPPEDLKKSLPTGKPSQEQAESVFIQRAQQGDT